ncbi:MAG: PKD domain-containing protein, partial [Bacteroidia bacterium]
VTVNPLPTVTVNSSTICVGQQTATLTAGGASTYIWSPSATLSNNIGDTVTGTPVTTTNYTVIGTDNNGCQNLANATIVVNGLPTITTSSATPTCVPLCTTFSVTSNPAASNYVWNFGDGQTLNSSLNPASTAITTAKCFTVSGTFAVSFTITDINSCVNTVSTTATAYPIPLADFEFQPQPISIVAPQVQFTNQSVGLISTYNWNFGDTYGNGSDTSNLINPSYTYSNVATYSVTLLVTSPKGCTSKVTKPLVVEEIYVLYVPNAFSPNGDNTNDIFKAVGEGISKFKLYIFDRWGNTLFYSDDMNKGWDGTFQGKGSQQILQEDVYVWKIDATDFVNKAHALHGTVTLVK